VRRQPRGGRQEGDATKARQGPDQHTPGVR
jgi:hypothetical protein